VRRYPCGKALQMAEGEGIHYWIQFESGIIVPNSDAILPAHRSEEARNSFPTILLTALGRHDILTPPKTHGAFPFFKKPRAGRFTPNKAASWFIWRN